VFFAIQRDTFFCTLIQKGDKKGITSEKDYKKKKRMKKRKSICG